MCIVIKYQTKSQDLAFCIFLDHLSVLGNLSLSRPSRKGKKLGWKMLEDNFPT